MPHARALCTEYTRLSAEVDALHGLQSGHIRIGTFSSVATHWLPYILQAFSRDYPGIDYELLPGRAHISAATRQFLRYLDRRNAPEAPAGCTGFDNRP